MSIELINIIIILIIVIATIQIKGAGNLFRLQFDWISLVLSLVAGFFTAAFTAGIIEAAYKTKSIDLGSETSILLIAINVFVWYVLIDAIRRKNKPSKNW